MSVVIVVQTLFPNADARATPRRPRSPGRLSHLFAVAFALVPLAAMGQVFANGV